MIPYRYIIFPIRECKDRTLRNGSIKYLIQPTSYSRSKNGINQVEYLGNDIYQQLLPIDVLYDKRIFSILSNSKIYLLKNAFTEN